MMPRARARGSRRRLSWPFGPQGNRRVRATVPAQPRPPSPPLWTRLVALFARWQRTLLALLVLAALAGAGWAGRYYVTHARHFALGEVRVTPLRHVSAEAMLARVAVPLGGNLFAIDRDAVARAVSQEPWVQSVHVRRELPSALVLDVTEREPACAVALGALYLADGNGNAFKRATPEEAVALPVVTGVTREEYLTQPEHARELVAQALRAITTWRAQPGRAPLGELHVDRIAGVTVYTDRGVGVRIGAVDDTLAERLRRYDAVAGALTKSGEEPRLIYVDNRARPDRVTVKLAAAASATHSGTKD
jgi:cell division protein FtsQ